MEKAFVCDHCNQFVKVASGNDLFLRSGFRVELKYYLGKRTPRGTYFIECDLCNDCRFEILKEIVTDMEFARTKTWEDLK